MSSKKKVNIGIIGGGGRSMLAKHLFKISGNVHLKSIYDPNPEAIRERLEAFGIEKAETPDNYETVANDPEIDWIMVFSPNCYHREHITAAFKAGKNVFSEKPLATTIEDCEAIFKAHKKSGLAFATGFVLRYAPLYRKVRELLDKNYIGKILSIDANENIPPDHGSYIMKNWRRFTKYSGPHILEKCCHDLDLINWFTGSLPSKAASFGGRNFFTPENAHFMEKFRRDNGTTLFDGWKDPEGQPCPFKSEKDILDNQVAILEYRNNIRVMFQATMSNAIPERRMYFSGTEGTMIAELYSGELKGKRLDEDAVKTYKMTGGGHAGGDEFIMEGLYDSMVNGVKPECGGEEGLDSAITALAVEKAATEKKVVDLEPVWAKLER
jgi:predicted dehydrogenase